MSTAYLVKGFVDNLQKNVLVFRVGFVLQYALLLLSTFFAHIYLKLEGPT